MKRPFVGQNTRLWSSQPSSGIATKASVNRGADFAGVAPTVDVTCQAEPPTKKTKVLVNKEATKTLPSRLLPRRWPSQRPLVEGRAADGGTRSLRPQNKLRSPNTERQRLKIRSKHWRLGFEPWRVAQKKAEDLLAVERDTTSKKAQAMIAQYKETLSFKFGLEKINWVS
ncbi:hypothetical protein BHE74_00011336 [Ensete ventricosum]|nr:hypothetical protein BHE74_00011336 [Ensete ventricosum]